MADFNYGSLHDLVDGLLKGAKTEADLRSAANRAYYSAYGTLRKGLVMDAPPDRFGRTGRHQPLVYACINHADKNVKTVGHLLRDLKLLREQADYEWTTDVLEPAVAKAMSKASIAVLKIRQLGVRELSQLHAAI